MPAGVSGFIFFTFGETPNISQWALFLCKPIRAFRNLIGSNCYTEQIYRLTNLQEIIFKMHILSEQNPRLTDYSARRGSSYIIGRAGACSRRYYQNGLRSLSSVIGLYPRPKYLKIQMRGLKRKMITSRTVTRPRRNHGRS